jgi:hypothetical protein
MPLLLLSFIGGAKSALSALLGFVSKPPGTYIAIVVCCALAVWWYGNHEFSRGEAAIKAAQEKAATQIIDRQNKITLTVGMKFDQVKLADAKSTTTRLNEVPVHVSAKADAACPIPLGFVRVFNGAAHGPVPEAAAGTDEASSGVALSDVAKASVINDGEYDQVADQLRSLQSWVQQQEDANPPSK